MQSVYALFAGFLALFISACMPTVSDAGGTAENLILVVNAESASSLNIANHYIKWRKVPPKNVIYLTGIGNVPSMTIVDFREKILKPVISEIRRRKLSAQIDYIVYSSGFPTRLSATKDIELDPNADQIKKNRILRGVLSTNAATYYLPIVMQKQLGYLSLNGNWYMRQSTRNLFRRPFVGTAQDEYQTGLLAVRNQNYTKAIESFQPLAERYKDNFVLSYQLARCYAQLEKADKAIQWLEMAARAGSPTRGFIATDTNFDSIRSNAAFKKVVQKFPDASFDYLPSQGFRSRYAWQPNGVRAMGANTGRKYFLSTMLAVTTFKNVNTDAEALRYLKSAVDADATKPRGKFYFTKTGDVRSKTRIPNFPVAISELKKLGHTVEIVAAHVPKDKHDIVGCLIGRSRWNWAAFNNKILPGAICENLTSFGGVLGVDKNQTPLTDFLRHGAAGSSGTTCEPYAIQAKFPHPMIHVHYARGCSLAEAFYQSIQGPFQLLIVGDPLCQPFASPQPFKASGLTPNQQVSGRVEIEITPENGQDSLSHFELFTDGVFRANLPVGRKVTFDSRELSDGYHELRIVGVANHQIETRSRKIIPFIVNNSQQSVKIQASSAKLVLGRKLQLSVEATGAASIAVFQNGRKIDSVKGASGKIEVSTSILGEGPTSIYAVAEINGTKIESKPLELTISR